VSAATPPVFVDDTGRRRILTRRAGRIVVLGFSGYLGLVALGFARDPQVGPVHLPTFGLPSLGLVVPPAPAVLGAQATRTAADAQAGEAEEATAPRAQVESPSTTTGPRPATSPPSVTPTASRAGAPTTGPQASNTSTTTFPSTSTTTTSGTATTSTTTTTMPGQGQGQGVAQRSDAASTKGPDDSRPPGQQRKTTTTTVG
jgi:hypothetical protein